MKRCDATKEGHSLGRGVSWAKSTVFANAIIMPTYLVTINQTHAHIPERGAITLSVASPPLRPSPPPTPPHLQLMLHALSLPVYTAMGWSQNGPSSRQMHSSKPWKEAE